MQGDIERTLYTDISGTARTIIAKDGYIKGMFRGLHWRIALISTTFFLVNKLKVVIAPVMFPA